MNERIRELHNKVFAESMNMRWNIEDAEYFAELIVRECVEVIDNRSKKDFHPTSYSGELLHYVTTDLKQHFGVEE